MWDVNDLIVFSDFHLSAEADAPLFRSDKDLSDCLRWVREETRESVIVFAGDVFDLLLPDRCSGKSGFDRSACQLDRIIEHHPEILDSLAKLAQSPSHTLVVMSGESDAEMILPDVQERIGRRLGVDTLKTPIRWLVQGEALRVRLGNTVVLIEHGNALDPWNRLNYDGLHRFLSLASRNLYDPREIDSFLGAELITQLISQLSRDHCWVNCLRPANEAVLPLLGSVVSGAEQSALLEFADRYDSMRVAAINRKLSNLLDPNTLFCGDREAEASTQVQAFKEWTDVIRDCHENKEPESSFTDRALIKAMRLTSTDDSFFDIAQPDQTTRYLEPIFASGTDLVIHGHTRSAKAYKVDNNLYVNTGAWSQLLRLPNSNDGDDVWQGFVARLRTDEAEASVRPTFARVERGTGGRVFAKLIEWRHSAPENLSLWQHANQNWRSEN
jgi:UDP-2,3-diacylglucosamine pyrophosphatase LpxH